MMMMKKKKQKNDSACNNNHSNNNNNIVKNRQQKSTTSMPKDENNCKNNKNNSKNHHDKTKTFLQIIRQLWKYGRDGGGIVVIASSVIRRTIQNQAYQCTVPVLIIIRYGILFRLFVLVAMAISCQLLYEPFIHPSFNIPGTDVLTFDLRLQSSVSASSSQQHHNQNHHQLTNSMSVADSSYSWKDSIIYNFLLTPLTRWDAARFLQLAADDDASSKIRYPQPKQQQQQRIQTKIDKQQQQQPVPRLVEEGNQQRNLLNHINQLQQEQQQQANEGKSTVDEEKDDDTVLAESLCLALPQNEAVNTTCSYLERNDNAQHNSNNNTIDSKEFVIEYYYYFDEADLIRAEQAHAFLPMFPWFVRMFATIMYRLLPSYILPGTWEGIVTLSAFLFNTICSIGASYELYQMTFLLLSSSSSEPRTTSVNEIHRAQRQQQQQEQSNLGANTATLYPASRNNDSAIMNNSIRIENCQKYSKLCAVLFLMNPATIFFSTAYSEAIASYFIFRGCRHAMMSRQQQQQHDTDTASSTNRRNIITSSYHFISMLVFWLLACCTRSNACLYTGFIILYGIGLALQQCHSNNNHKKSLPIRFLYAIIYISVSFGLSIFMASASIGWHNYKGNRHFCTSYSINQTTYLAAGNRNGTIPSITFKHPDWCNVDESNTASPNLYFHLYAYIQRKHWDVGLLRYWQWKQIPNFILAAPVLTLSTLAVVRWIQISWKKSRSSEQTNTMNINTKDQAKILLDNDSNNSKVRLLISFIENTINWALNALQDFATNDISTSCNRITTDRYITGCATLIEKQLPNNNTYIKENERQEATFFTSSLTDRDDANRAIHLLTGSPMLLGHYAVLAASTLLGLLLAHVQISTRLICSSCPALYWYMTAQIIKDGTRTTSKNNDDSKTWTSGDIIVGWCLLYILLGVIMYPNWLPWT